jgi:hypothetical protein
MSITRSETAVCKHCGGKLVRCRTTERAKGWAHEAVVVNGHRHTLSEACRINPETLADARGTTYAEPG